MNPGEAKNEISRRLKDSELKKNEREIIGELLVDFFELERNLNHLLTESILDPMHEHSLDTLLVNTPLRHRIEAAREFSLLGIAEAKTFHKLCDDRNKLAHVPPQKKRITDLFPPDTRELFVRRCAELNSAISKRRLELFTDWFDGAISSPKN